VRCRDQDLHAVAHVPLRHDAAEVRFHRSLRHDQRARDLSVRHPLGETLQHLLLAVGERLERVVAAYRLRIAHVLDQQRGDAR